MPSFLTPHDPHREAHAQHSSEERSRKKQDRKSQPPQSHPTIPGRVSLLDDLQGSDDTAGAQLPDNVLVVKLALLLLVVRVETTHKVAPGLHEGAHQAAHLVAEDTADTLGPT